MPTLNENIAEVKKAFRDIKHSINDNIITVPDETPVATYPTAIKDGVVALSNKSYENGFVEGWSDGFQVGWSEGEDEGIKEGKAEALANSKYIPKRVSGKVITLTDVSEVAHTVKVYGDMVNGDYVNVDVYGKSLLPYPYVDTTKITNGITFTDNGDGSVVVSGTATADAYFVLANMDLGTSGIVASDSTFATNGTYSVSTQMQYNKDNKNLTLLIPNGKSYATPTVFYPIIVTGSTYDGKWEPYTHQTLLAIPEEVDEGEEFTKVNKTPSICPVMNFFADSDITVDYFGSFGMQESQNRFADTFQVNGERRDYTSAFYGSGWTDYTFEQAVNYDIVATICNQMFYASKITDLAAIMKKKNISIVFEGTNSNFVSIFQSSAVTHIPALIMPEKASATKLARGCKSLHTIDGLVCNENTKYDESFLNCGNLTHCIFGGVIANNIDLHWSTRLDRASILSLLQTLTATVAGVVATLPSMCIDGATDTLAMIQGDTELNTAYTQALANGYTITFV